MRDAIPRFFVYGEPERAIDIGFLHVETVMARRNVHSGRVTPHLHAHMAQLTYWTKGSGRYVIEDRAWDFSAPAVSVVPSNVVHGFTVEPNSDAIVVSIANDEFHQLLSPLPGSETPLFVSGEGNGAVWQRLDIAMSEILAEFSFPQGDTALALRALITVALVNIRRLQEHVDMPAVPAMVQLAARFEKEVDLQFRTATRVSSYVATLGTTPHLLDKASRSVIGVPPKEIITRRIMLEARRLLQFTVRPVEDVAFELGFADPAYFSRFFRERSGVSPSQWRAARIGEAG